MFSKKLTNIIGRDLSNKKIAIWGLAFKPDTDDIREAPALKTIELLLEAGCKNISVYDPVAMNEAKRVLGDKVGFAKDMYEAVEDADAILLMTEWKQFRMPLWQNLKQRMNNYLIIDGRNIYDKGEVTAEGFTYVGIGK